ncbi:MAG: AI-2E family transporter [Clostridia bacterium]|nr:AI-2E family transporter [Clostridia bacterium]
MKRIFDEKYGKIALYVISCVIVTAVLLALWLNIGAVIGVFESALRVFSPVIYAVIAVLIINPSIHMFEERVFAFLDKPGKRPHPRLRRVLSVVCGYLLFAVLLFAVIVIVFVPLAENIKSLQVKIPGAINRTLRWIEVTITKNEFLAPQRDTIMEYIENSLIFSPEVVQNLIGSVVEHATAILSETFNVLIGIIISVYIILSMGHLKSLRDKIMAAFFSTERTDLIRREARSVYRVFSDFITGRLMYSITLGIVFFYALYMLGVPFYSLISIAMGMVAFVPVCGTVLSYTLGLVLCVLFDPQDAGWCMLIFFAVFLAGRIFLQPHLIKENATASIGLCIIAVIIMYALFGIVGTLLAVPLFIVIKRWIIFAVNKRAAKKDTGVKKAS